MPDIELAKFVWKKAFYSGGKNAAIRKNEKLHSYVIHGDKTGRIYKRSSGLWYWDVICWEGPKMSCMSGKPTHHLWQAKDCLDEVLRGFSGDWVQE
jgi:hypothetical protein